eukprot:Skav232551  [mRNA]  locus=scaffold3309:18809:19357:- [translate_table: standard]
MADVDLGFAPSGEGLGHGFGDASFSTEPENSSFEISGDGFDFGQPQNDAWFVEMSGEAPGFEGEKKKKKKKSKKEKAGSHESWLEEQIEDPVRAAQSEDLPPVHTARRVSFSDDPPESRTFGVNDFADKVARVASSPQWENFARDEVFEAQTGQAPCDSKTERFAEPCSNCGRPFELTDAGL